jgi:hypothetical protein
MLSLRYPPKSVLRRIRLLPYFCAYLFIVVPFRLFHRCHAELDSASRIISNSSRVGQGLTFLKKNISTSTRRGKACLAFTTKHHARVCCRSRPCGLDIHSSGVRYGDLTPPNICGRVSAPDRPIYSIGLISIMDFWPPK